MVLYLGTSSLVKMYLRETFSTVIKEWVQAARIAATCRIAYTEVISALDLRHKNNDLTKNDYELVLSKFSQDWARLPKSILMIMMPG